MQPHVIQHELFIRAATEGRRDHVYQAAMFDPLTSATLSLDRIVELCDELIATHGDLLPCFEGKRTLVPGSGKQFGPADPKALRSGWRQRRAECEMDFISEWQVIGPFPSAPRRYDGLELCTPVERTFLARGDGQVDLAVLHDADGVAIGWRSAFAGKRGFVDFGETIARREWVVGYGYAELESSHDRDALFRCGSDDGIKIWLNGNLVHHHEVGRGYVPGADEVLVRLRAGINGILVKIDNYTGGWGFGIAVSAETPLRRRAISNLPALNE
jgi:hypothetical protein